MLELFAQLLSWCRPARLVRWCAYLVVFAVGWVVLNYSTLQKLFDARERLQSYEHEVAQLRKQHDALSQERAELQVGGFSAEKTIRERFHMIKPGEKIIFFETPDLDTTLQ